MSDKGYATLYPTSTSKIWRRIRDVPGRLSEARDTFFPGEFAQLHHLVQSHTMCSHARLCGLYYAVRHVVAHGIPGDIVECGTAHGGSAALMALTVKQLGADRMVWVFDTFEGLPAPSASDPDYEIAAPYVGSCRGELTEVKDLFSRLEILDRAHLVKGLFQDTVPNSTVEALAVLHLDADWYESTKVCLDHFYDRVSPGGVIQIDDYGHWAGARKALNEFLHRREITVRLRYLDYTGRQFMKPRESNHVSPPTG